MTPNQRRHTVQVGLMTAGMLCMLLVEPQRIGIGIGSILMLLSTFAGSWPQA